MAEQPDLLVFDDEVCRPLIDMGALCASAGVLSGWIKIVPIGSWRHPNFGQVDITPDVVKQIVANFNARVTGVDVPVEAPEHQHDGKGAYGWVHELEARPDGVWARFQWTEQGYQAFSGATFKYLSPEIHLSRSPWFSPRGERIANVLVRVSPTNDPFFRYDGSNRLAATLGEYTFSASAAEPEAVSHEDAPEEQSESVDRYKPEDAPDSDPEAPAGAEADGQVQKGEPGMDSEVVVTDAEDTSAEESPPLEATAGDDAEQDAAFKAVAAENEALKARLAAAEGKVAAVEGKLQAVLAEKRRAEVIQEFSAMKFSRDVLDNHGRVIRRVEGVLSPADRELCAEIYQALPEDLAAKFSARMANGGFEPVLTGDLGGGLEPDDDSVYDEYPPKTVEAAKALRASNPTLSPLQAINTVLRDRL